MRSDPHIVRSETAVEPQPALLLDDLARAIQDALVGEPTGLRILLLLLQASLDKVERQGEETGKESRDSGRGKGLVLSRQASVLLQLRLGLGKEGQLADVERHGTDDGRESTSPQSRDTFVLGDAEERVHDGAVVGPRLGRFETV